MASDARDPKFHDDLAAARSGDRGALERLLARLQDRLLREADRNIGPQLRGKTRPSDVLQDAFVEVVRRIAEFGGEDEATFFAWVRSIIVNVARQQHRHLRADRRRAPTRTSQLELLAQAILRSTRSPATRLEQAEAVTVVLRALEALREDHRLVIEQTVFHKRPIAEVARDLGRSEAATRMLLSRARAALTLAIDRNTPPRGGGA